MAFLRRALRPVLTTLTLKDSLTFSSADDVVFVAHLAPGDDGLRERFAALARQYRDRYTFAVGPQANRESVIECFNNPDGERHSTKSMEAVESLEGLVRACATPLIGELTRRNELEYLGVSCFTSS